MQVSSSILYIVFGPRTNNPFNDFDISQVAFGIADEEYALFALLIHDTKNMR